MLKLSECLSGIVFSLCSIKALSVYLSTQSGYGNRRILQSLKVQAPWAQVYLPARFPRTVTPEGMVTLLMLLLKKAPFPTLVTPPPISTAERWLPEKAPCAGGSNTVRNGYAGQLSAGKRPAAGYGNGLTIHGPMNNEILNGSLRFYDNQGTVRFLNEYP
jgi:hypothetical protein